MTETIRNRLLAIANGRRPMDPETIFDAADALAALEAERDRLREAVDLYVVWSNQHRLWWRPECRGYTPDVRQAGVYSRAYAMSISHKGRDGWAPGERPAEIPVRVSDLPEWAIAALKGETP